MSSPICTCSLWLLNALLSVYLILGMMLHGIEVKPFLCSWWGLVNSDSCCFLRFEVMNHGEEMGPTGFWSRFLHAGMSVANSLASGPLKWCGYPVRFQTQTPAPPATGRASSGSPSPSRSSCGTKATSVFCCPRIRSSPRARRPTQEHAPSSPTSTTRSSTTLPRQSPPSGLRCWYHAWHLWSSCKLLADWLRPCNPQEMPHLSLLRL